MDTVVSDRQFYVGISACGCLSAMLVDDETTTPKEVADFARRMQKTKRTVGHRSVAQADIERLFTKCPHKEPSA